MERYLEFLDLYNILISNGKRPPSTEVVCRLRSKLEDAKREQYKSMVATRWRLWFMGTLKEFEDDFELQLQVIRKYSGDSRLEDLGITERKMHLRCRSWMYAIMRAEDKELLRVYERCNLLRIKQDALDDLEC